MRNAKLVLDTILNRLRAIVKLVLDTFFFFLLLLIISFEQWFPRRFLITTRLKRYIQPRSKRNVQKISAGLMDYFFQCTVIGELVT